MLCQGKLVLQSALLLLLLLHQRSIDTYNAFTTVV
jgi:hypothetical protein